MANDDTSGIGCVLALGAWAAGGATGYWLAGYYDVTDPVTLVLAVVAGSLVLAMPYVLLGGLAAMAFLSFVVTPIMWMVTWERRPGWESLVDDEVDDD